MEFQREPGRIYAEEEGRVIAEVTFPDRDGAADIDHTFVDDTLRGQGVAGQLLRAAADQIRAEGKRARATCSYAEIWFERHPEEADLLDTYVRLSGLTKQDYITRRLLDKAVVVQGNPRVFKVLRNELAAVLDELRRIEAGTGVNDELMDTIHMIAEIMDGMKEDNAYDD